MKNCTTCKQELTSENAFKNKASSSGLSAYCRDCTKTREKARRDKNTEAWSIMEDFVLGVDDAKERAIKLLKSVGKR